MHAVQVNDVRLPLPIGGHVALDFANTYAGWNEPIVEAGEWLKDYAVLAEWGGYNQLYDAATTAGLRRSAARDPATAATVLTRVRSFRTHLHRALLDPSDARALAGISGTLREAGTLGSLVVTPEGPRWRLDRRAGLMRPLLLVAHEAEHLLTSPTLGDLDVCPGHECGWMFLDPRGRRRWCSMSSCGNRAKVAAYAARRR